ncbi:MAG: DNA replication complex subunit Gins51 [Promethearchaeota archaeon]
MDLKIDYEKLYQHWLQEFENEELTKLSEDLYSKYKSNSSFLSNLTLNDEDKIKTKIIESYKENFEFLFNDFMKIREIKILNSALALHEIKINNLIEPERLFYQNLVSAIKGFKKVKASFIDDQSPIIEDEIIKEAQVETLDINEDFSQETSDLVSDYIVKEKTDQFNYILVKFLKKTPALVGIDLLNYGPFEKENIAFLPYENAKILIFEKFAQNIEL